jgi:oligopeptide/dipeptide ABC transporter ATP-binding protein
LNQGVVNSTLNSDEFLRVENLKKWFQVRGGFFRRKKEYVRAVDGISFSIRRGETFGLVGESGSGKTTVARCILRLIEPTSGDVYVEGTNIMKLKSKMMKSYRRKMQIVFQDPYASLDPRQTVKGALTEAMKVSGVVSSSEEAFVRAKELIEKVGLNEDHLYRFPHEFSGGQRQRIAIARALATSPEFLILDEPTSFLDVSVQAQILNLLKDLQKEFKLTYMFISHNLSVIAHMCDRIGVMYLGKLMEVSSKKTILSNPAHPYTYALFSAIPIPDPERPPVKAVVPGEVPSPLNPPPGCVFNTRCPYRRQRCSTEEPMLRDIDKGHLVACHFAEELSPQLRGFVSSGS